MRKILLALIVFAFTSSAYAGDLIKGGLDMRRTDGLNLSGKLDVKVNRSGSIFKDENPEYNLSRMKSMNPNFETYSDATGIIWLKHVLFSRSNSGGIEVTRLYVILGRQGLGGKWLNWNIPIPAKGSTEILEANVYDFSTLAKISSVTPEENITNGIINVKFLGLPDTFIITIAWREHVPDMLNVEGLSWFQEDLRVWEAILEVNSPQKLAYRTFPDRANPEIDDLNTEVIYTWRKINLDPYKFDGELARVERAGAAFGPHQGGEGANLILKNFDVNDIPVPSEALSGFKRSKKEGIVRLVEYLSKQPEITLAEGSPRKIPSSGALTQQEKTLLAKSWLSSRKVDANLCWQFPFEPDDKTPLCSGMFYSPVLEIPGTKENNFYDMLDPNLLAGAKIFSFTKDENVVSRRIPASSANSNKLSAIMNLKMTDQGMLSGTVKVILRGGWGALMLGSNPTEGTARGALLSLFPGLTNYKNVKIASVKGVPEISFTLENKPGVGGSGTGMLAIIPFFEPIAMRKLGGYDPPVDIRFPFVVDQNITIGFPKGVSQSLLTGKVNKNPDKINYSENYNNRRNRLVADARFELNMQNVSAGNMSLLRQKLDEWRKFSSKHIPIR